MECGGTALLDSAGTKVLALDLGPTQALLESTAEAGVYLGPGNELPPRWARARAGAMPRRRSATRASTVPRSAC